MSFAEQLAADAQATAVTITDIFAQQETPATRLEQAMLYATMNGGKRLRAALVLGAARLAATDAPPDPVEKANLGGLRVAAALEMMHA